MGLQNTAPSHYRTRKQPLHTLVEISPYQALVFSLWNIIKYAERAPYKGQAKSDLEKCIYYSKYNWGIANHLIENKGYVKDTIFKEALLDNANNIQISSDKVTTSFSSLELAKRCTDLSQLFLKSSAMSLENEVQLALNVAERVKFEMEINVSCFEDMLSELNKTATFNYGE